MSSVSEQKRFFGCPLSEKDGITKDTQGVESLPSLQTINWPVAMCHLAHTGFIFLN
jgi:hypothetical protein